jgi:diphthine-ammonia ligase
VDELIYIAGQIPLIPGCMQVIPGGILPQASLSLQHVDRVLDVLCPSLSGVSSVVLGICYLTNENFVHEAEAEWKKLISTEVCIFSLLSRIIKSYCVCI